MSRSGDTGSDLSDAAANAHDSDVGEGGEGEGGSLDGDGDREAGAPAGATSLSHRMHSLITFRKSKASLYIYIINSKQ